LCDGFGETNGQRECIVVKIVERVVSVLENISGVKEIDANTKLKNLGLDSIDTSEFFMELENEFEILVEDETWQGVETVQDVVEVIQQRI
jgi:acyl carrier protein